MSLDPAKRANPRLSQIRVHQEKGAFASRTENGRLLSKFPNDYKSNETNLEPGGTERRQEIGLIKEFPLITHTHSKVFRWDREVRNTRQWVQEQWLAQERSPRSVRRSAGPRDGLLPFFPGSKRRSGTSSANGHGLQQRSLFFETERVW